MTSLMTLQQLITIVLPGPDGKMIQDPKEALDVSGYTRFVITVRKAGLAAAAATLTITTALRPEKDSFDDAPGSVTFAMGPNSKTTEIKVLESASRYLGWRMEGTQNDTASFLIEIWAIE